MYAGALPPISNREDWDINFTLEDDDTGESLDVSGASIIFEVRDKLKRTILSATTDNGKIIIPEVGKFSVSFAMAEMSLFVAADYDIGCTITLNGTRRQLIIGTQPVLDGIVSQ